MILYMYIAPGQGQTAPRKQSFDFNRNVLSLHSFVASLKKMSFWSLILYNVFHDLIHVYSPGAGDKILMSAERVQTNALYTEKLCNHYIQVSQCKKNDPFCVWNNCDICRPFILKAETEFQCETDWNEQCTRGYMGQNISDEVEKKCDM